MSNFYYLIIDALTVSIPLIWSFEKKIYFYSKWKFVLPAVLITGLFLVVWDSIFTLLGVWGFNSNYLLGLYILNLPIEEVLFFMVVPFSCLFIYETVHSLLKNKIKKGFFYQFSLTVGLFLFFFGLYHYDKYYTLIASVAASQLLFFHCSGKKQINHEVFWISYLVILIPFTIVNGILTGYLTEQPIVWYNNSEIVGIHLLTIPIEDFIYNLLLLLMNITIYEHFLKRDSLSLKR